LITISNLIIILAVLRRMLFDGYFILA